MATVIGKITNVYIEDNGSALATDTALGSNSLSVDDAFDFQAEGGTLEVLGTQYLYTSVDFDLDVLFLAEPTIAAYSQDEMVYSIPKGATKFAQVDLNDDDEGLLAEVPISIYDLLPDGIREEDDQETVTVNDDFGFWQIDKVMGQEPSRDMSYSDPNTYTEAGITPREEFLDSVADVEADFAAAYAAIAAGDTANDEAIQAAVADYTAQFGDVNTSINNAIADYTAQFDTVNDTIDANTIAVNAALAARPKKTVSTSAPGTTANVAGEVWERYDNVGSTSRKLLAAWQGLGGNAWVPVSLDPVYIPQLDVNTGTFGNLISSRLTVSSFDNLLTDPNFTLPLGSAWQNQPYNSINPTGSRNGKPAMVITNTAAQNFVYNLPLDNNRIEANSWLRINVPFKPSVATTLGQVRAVVRFQDAAGVFSSAIVNGPATPAGFWWNITGQVMAPPGAVSWSLYVDTQASLATGTVTFDTPVVNRAMDSTLVVDGSIYGQHVAAKTIGGEKLVIADLQDMLHDTGKFKPTDAAAWTLSGGMAVGTGGVKSPLGSTSVLTWACTGQSGASYQDMPLNGGETYRVEGYAYKGSSAMTAGLVEIGIWAYDAASTYLGAYSTQYNSTMAVTGSWVKFSFDVELPPTTDLARMFIFNNGATGGTFYVTDLTVRRKNGGELIIDGSLTAQHVATKSLTTDRLLVSDLTNLISDPWFDSFGWAFSGTTYVDQNFADLAGKKSGVMIMYYGTSCVAESNYFDVKPGEQYNLSFDMCRSGAATGNYVVRIRWFDANHVNLGAPNYYTDLKGGPASGVPTAWATYSAYAVAPEGAKYGLVHIERYTGPFDAYLVFDNIRVNRRFGGELIVDGTLLARHITADMVNGLLATFGVIQTEAAANRGIKISTSGIIGYNTSGVAQTSIDPGTGRMTAVGGFTTANGTDDIVITPSSVYGPAAMYFMSNGPGLDNTLPPAMWMTDGTATVNGLASYSASVTVNGPKYGTIGGGGARPRIDITNYRPTADATKAKADIAYHAGGGGGWSGAHLFFIDGVAVHNTQTAGLTLQSGKSLGINVDAAVATSTVGANSIYALGGIKTSAAMFADTAFQTVSLAGGGLTGGSITNSGNLTRTSTIAMKENEREMTEDEAKSVLGLVSYTFEMKQDDMDVVKDPRRYPGFIAEQGAKAGAELWVARQHKVVKNKHGKVLDIKRDKKGKPIAFRTGDVTVAHNMLIKDLYKQNEDLRAEIQELKEMIKR